MRRFAVVLGSACLLAVLCAPANAYVLDSRPTGPRLITYYNATTQHRWALSRALRAWSNSGARVQFAPVARDEAELLITYRPGPPELAGDTSRTYLPDHRLDAAPGATEIDLPRFADAGDARSNRFVMALIAAHELGHALGLGHEEGTCAAMNPVILDQVPERCAAPAPGQWRCGLLTGDDVGGAVALLGGHPRRTRRAFCDIAPPPPRPPSRVRATIASAGRGSVELRWLNATSPTLLSVVVARAEGRCPAGPAEGESRSVAARPDSEQTVRFPLTLGRFCYSLWSKDARGRLSSQPSTLFSSGPAAPSPPRELSASPGGPLAPAGLASVHWVDPDDATPEEVVIVRTRGRCPGRPPQGRRHWLRRAITPGAQQTAVDFSFPSPGAVYCYAAWSRDRFGRWSRPTVTRG
jgi:matrixin